MLNNPHIRIRIRERKILNGEHCPIGPYRLGLLLLPILPEIRLNPLPGNLRALHRVKKLGRLAGLIRERRKHRKIRRKSADRPGRIRDLPAAEIDDQDHARHRDHVINRLHRILQKIRLHSLHPIILNLPRVPVGIMSLQPVRAVQHRVIHRIIRHLGNLTLFAAIRARKPVDNRLQFLSQHHRRRYEKTRQTRNLHIIGQHRDQVRQHQHAGIEKLRRELPHPLDTQIDVRQRLRHQVARLLPIKLLRAPKHDVVVNHQTHRRARLIREPADIKSLKIPHLLNGKHHAREP